MLFQPKWKTGSLFGGKGWNSGWKMGLPGSNLHRPGYGYGYGGSNLIPPASPAASGYIPGFSEQLNIAPFMVPPQMSSAYTSPADGWSVPFSGYPSSTSGQAQLGSYGEGGYTPSSAGGGLPSKQTDAYGTKGASTISPGGNKLYTTTKK